MWIFQCSVRINEVALCCIYVVAFSFALLFVKLSRSIYIMDCRHPLKEDDLKTSMNIQ